LKVRGNAKDPLGTHARLAVSSLVIRTTDEELLRASDIEALLENGELRLAPARLHLFAEGVLDVRGSAALFGKGEGQVKQALDVSAKGRIPLRAAEGLVPGIQEPAGEIELEVSADGPASRPSLSADIRLHNAGMTISETLQKVRGVNGRIQADGDRVVVSSLSGRLDGGEFSLAGSAALEGFMPKRADFRVRAHAFPLVVPEVLQAQLSTELEFSGSPSDFRLSGEVQILEGRYYKDFNLSLLDAAGGIGGRSREIDLPGMEREGFLPPFLRRLSLDLSLSSRQPLIMDNNLALLRIRPALRITGTAGDPLVTGRAEVTEGTIQYRSTEFEVEKGVVDFVNPYRIEPTLDIRAGADVRQWRITLQVSGTPEELDFRLSSEPPEADADILSLLAVGKTTRELASGSGGAGRPPEEMLANLVGGRLADRVKEGTGLDIVEFEYRKDAAGAESAEQVRVTVGKELSRRLAVKYGVERKSGVVVHQSTAVYRLLENLAVNAYQDTQGTFGGEMRYRLEFR
jgi:autotransporter translocation and assembly factor TamB